MLAALMESIDRLDSLDPEMLEEARQSLARDVRMRFNSPVPMGIARWIRDGELGAGIENTNDLYEALGRGLDKACTGDIFGDVVFEDEDGVVNVVTVEACVDEVNQQYLRELLDDTDEEEEDAMEEVEPALDADTAAGDGALEEADDDEH